MAIQRYKPEQMGGYARGTNRPCDRFQPNRWWQTLSPDTDRQQPGSTTRDQTARLIQRAPVEHLIRVDSVRPRYARHRRALHQRLFDDPPLLRDAAPQPLRYD